jgi:hypothetical protein
MTNVDLVQRIEVAPRLWLEQPKPPSPPNLPDQLPPEPQVPDPLPTDIFPGPNRPDERPATLPKEGIYVSS